MYFRINRATFSKQRGNAKFLVSLGKLTHRSVQRRGSTVEMIFLVAPLLRDPRGETWRLRVQTNGHHKGTKDFHETEFSSLSRRRCCLGPSLDLA